VAEISRQTALWLSDRRAIAFSVEVDGREIPCFVGTPVLAKGSGMEIRRSSDAMRAFHTLKLRFLPALETRIRAGASGEVEVLESDLPPA